MGWACQVYATLHGDLIADFDKFIGRQRGAWGWNPHSSEVYLVLQLHFSYNPAYGRQGLVQQALLVGLPAVGMRRFCPDLPSSGRPAAPQRRSGVH